MLWACDLNAVRGRLPGARACGPARRWSGNIYPQDDDAHRQAAGRFWTGCKPPSLRQFHNTWNGLDDRLQWPDDDTLREWTAVCRQPGPDC